MKTESLVQGALITCLAVLLTRPGDYDVVIALAASVLLVTTTVLVYRYFYG